MTRLPLILASGLALGILALSPADASEVSNYSIGELLGPCVDADNDARGGAEAEMECEQYISGFTDAVALLAGATGQVCLPEQNRPDEVRWAFMKWATQNYGERHQPAAVGMMATLEAAFPCP